ncbi:hypothetical protein L596_028586 [Steinernema carpocapsae]|uniref:Uncharacterized protein n=1 Tax=Steinernema carpocapsae TaxID=34508 RepID=A0A4U5LYZ2_STECR|nr:hypothetical protein L596_028586 [Steinernema carpocapsae]
MLEHVSMIYRSGFCSLTQKDNLQKWSFLSYHNSNARMAPKTRVKFHKLQSDCFEWLSRSSSSRTVLSSPLSLNNTHFSRYFL